MTDRENDIEHYDLEIPDISVTECGTYCTEGINCVGFAYKPVEGTCYLSKTSILGEPIDSLYKDVYTKLDRRCNKINRITDDKIIDDNTMTRNSIYICSDGESNAATEFQYANMGGTSLENVRTTIFDRADSDNIKPVEVQYEIRDIDWPKTKTKKTDNISFKPMFLDDSTKSNTQSSIINNKKYGFIESDNEFLGQYMLHHQCVANVSLFDCIKYCENNQLCAGTEWNKSIINRDDDDINYLYENVCCPKKIISKIIPRRDKMSRGKFYVKKEIDNLKDPIVLSKIKTQNGLGLELVPFNKSFHLKMTDIDKENKNNKNNVNYKFIEADFDLGYDITQK